MKWLVNKVGKQESNMTRVASDGCIVAVNKGIISLVRNERKTWTKQEALS